MDVASRYCLLFTMRYSLGSLAVALLMLYIAAMVATSAGMDVKDILDGGGIGTMLLKLVASAVPIAIISYIIGSHIPGSKGRLISRLIMNIYLAMLMLLVGSHPDYLIGDMVINDSITVASMYLEMDAMHIALILMVIPVCSIMDAIIEYQEESGGFLE